MSNEYLYYNNCVGWDQSDVTALVEMIDRNIEISRRTFLKHVNRNDLADMSRNWLGYNDHHSQGLTMAQDWAISYHRSKLHGETVYYFRHSAIEYVFTKEMECEK